MTLVKFLKILDLLIGKDDASSIGFSHQQIFAQSSATFPQHFIRHHRYDSREGIDETMDMFHVEIECSHCI
jgi:hypothetical protein